MKNINEYITNSVDETVALAKNIFSSIDTGCVVTLSGDLGVGKTAFTKGIALGLDINDVITSPTFTLLKEYEGRLKLKHIDAYRLEGVDSDSLGLFDLIDTDTVVVLEWANYLDDLGFKPDYLVKIEFLEQDRRSIRIEALR